MKTVTRVRLLNEDGEKFFGEGPARLLLAVDETGSLREAARRMDLSYTKALRMMKNAEDALGLPLTRTCHGGSGGGGSALTEGGRAFLNRFSAYRDACARENEALFRQYFPAVGCVIMASGHSRRFGENKLLASFCGAPMIERAFAATRGRFDRRVVVTRYEEVASLARKEGIAAVVHEMPDKSDTVRLGIREMADLPLCMFVPADQPCLTAGSVAMMVACAREDPQSIVRLRWDGAAGAPVLFPRWCYGELEDLQGEQGGGAVAARHPDRIVYVEAQNAQETRDADTLEALRELETAFGWTGRGGD